MDDVRIKQLLRTYKDGLLGDTLPFWITHSVDRQDGGFLFCLDRDGSLLDTDKPMWIQSRFVWLLCTLYNTVEKNPQWLELAKHGLDFILKHGVDDDGRMFFLLTKDGRPLRKRRYLFSEFFAVLALAAYAEATGDKAYGQKAHDLFELIGRHLNTPGLLPSKLISENRSLKGLGVPMMLICTAQQMRSLSGLEIYDKIVTDTIAEVQRDFVNDRYRCVLENVGPDGAFVDHFDGRLVTPGHGIEVAWFILHEALLKNKDARLIALGCKMVDYCWERGWDGEHGGMLYYRDAKGLPCTEYWHDMKFWWPHNEAIIATLLAWYLTGDSKYADWHKQVHDWAYAHFPDPEHGEWFGYLHRDGSVSSTIKGNIWKGPFHLPRMQWYCAQLLENVSIERTL